MDKDDLKGKVIQLFGEAEQRKEPSVSVTGNGNIVGGRDVIVNTEKIVNKTVVETKPGSAHITEEQAAILQKLVKDIVKLEGKLKQRPATFQKVWSALNAHMKVGKYRLIPHEKFSAAEKYLRKWIGRINSAKSAPKKNTEWRSQRYRHNHVVAKKHNLYPNMRNYMMEKFGVESQRDLDNDELDQLYRRMAAWKRSAR